MKKPESPCMAPPRTWFPQFPLLPWQASAALLSLACVPVAWLCLAAAVRGWPQEGVGPWALALVVLLGLGPFFMRRNCAFTLGGLAAVAAVGLGLAAAGWLFRFNFIVFAWLGMGWVLRVVARPTAWGRMVAHQIALETTVQRHALDTPTARKERMWVVMDVAAVLLAGLVLLWVVAVAGG